MFYLKNNKDKSHDLEILALMLWHAFVIREDKGDAARRL
jgi:hypothetical protein